MSPQEIQDAYAVVVQDIQNQTAQEAARIGNSQRSLGTLAERVASPSGQTSGLANYTYDRTMRPVVDSLTTSLTTAGKAAGLEELLKSKLRDAKRNYENAKNSYTVASSGGGGNNGNTDDPYSEQNYDQLGEDTVSSNTIAEGTILGTGTTGNGIYDVIVADGKGGQTIHSYATDSAEKARALYILESSQGRVSGFSTNGGFSGAGGGGVGGGGR